MNPRKESSRYEASKHEGVFRDKRSGIFYLRDTVKGEWLDKSLKTKSITEAKIKADHLRGLVATGGGIQKGGRRTFDEAFDLVVKIQSPKAEKTVEQAKDIIDGHLRPWFTANCKYLDTFAEGYEEVWAEYVLAQPGMAKAKIERLKAEGKPFNHIKVDRKLAHDRRYLITTWKRAIKKEWVKKVITKNDLDLNETTDPIGKYIEDDDIRKLLKACQPYPKIYLQVLMALTMGMRISEILHLKKDEVNLEKREIDLNPKRIKTRRRREVEIPISDDVLPLLRQAYQDAPGAYIFPAQYHNREGRPIDPNKPQDDNRYYWDKIRNETGVELRFHDLKHTCVTNMLEAGIPETAIRKMVGTSEETLRRIYAHIEKKTRARFRSIFTGRFTGGAE